MQYLQVITTTPTQEQAQALARRLVELQLAACVQVVGPIESVYRWQGKIETAQEWQCWIKTCDDRYEELERAIKASHPYDTPEILALAIGTGSPAYLAWLEAETRPTKPD